MGRQKIERENARRGPCQSDRGVKRWARADSSEADAVLAREEPVKTRKEEEKKKAGVFVASCCVGGFEGHIMCLISSGSEPEATSFLSSPRLASCALCVLLSRCTNTPKIQKAKKKKKTEERASVQLLIERQIWEQKNSNGLKKNVYGFKSCLENVCCKVHIHGLLRAQSGGLCRCLPSQQKLPRIRCLNPGFPVEGSSPSSLHHLPTSQYAPFHHTGRGSSVLRRVISRWSRKESSEPGGTPPGAWSSSTRHIILDFTHFISDAPSFPQRPPVSEQVLCYTSCSRTLQQGRQMCPGSFRGVQQQS